MRTRLHLVAILLAWLLLGLVQGASPRLVSSLGSSVALAEGDSVLGGRVVDERGRPVPHATVHVRRTPETDHTRRTLADRQADSEWIRQTDVDAEGRFPLEDLEPGMQVAASATNRVGRWFAVPDPLPASLTLELVPAVRVRGHVGATLPTYRQGVSVTLDEATDPGDSSSRLPWFVVRPTCEIDEIGFYQLEGLPPGDLHLVTEGDPELSAWDGEAWVGALAAGEHRDDVDFWLPDPLARIQLRLVDAAGRPLAGERARWIALDPDPWDGDDAESDEEGRISWAISRGPPLDIKRISGTGLVPLVASLPRDGPERVIVCEPTPTHRLRVHVEDETGTTVIPKWVMAGALDRERQEGEYVPGAFIEPTADLAELVVRADPPFRVGAGMEGGWIEGQVEVHALPPDGIVRVVVREHDRLRGSVTWENGLPVSGVDVCFTEEGGSGCVAHARTDGQGRFDMPAPAGRSKGRLTAHLRAGAFSARLEPQSADARERTDWILHRTSWVTGEVRAPDGECVPPA
ncbi:MAG: hypothetical protein KDB73_13460, partial [Planctomycetes bacterium]|nr:hypothetical protein [Planctomycetota bacterium]